MVWLFQFDLLPSVPSIFVSLRLSSLPMPLGVVNSWKLMRVAKTSQDCQNILIWPLQDLWKVPRRVCIDLINCLNLSENGREGYRTKYIWLTPEHNAIVCKRKWQAWGWSRRYQYISSDQVKHYFICMLSDLRTLAQTSFTDFCIIWTPIQALMVHSFWAHSSRQGSSLIS